MKSNDAKLIAISRYFSSFSAVQVNKLKNKSTGNADTELKQWILIGYLAELACFHFITDQTEGGRR